jgi:DNA-binding LacI/PurR family transcriptional regulator
MVTIKDVAKHAGVTIGTVSRVLNNKKWVSEECKQRVRKSIQELHYKPQAHARRLRQKYSKIWGVIAPHQTKIFKSSFLSSILSGLEEVAAEDQYRLLLHPLSEMVRSQISYRMLLGDGSVDGMFVLNAWSTDTSIRDLTEAQVPFVLINGKIIGHNNLPFVGVDNKGGVDKALDYLFRLGHQKIGMINGRMNTTNALERFQAFQEKMAMNNLELRNEWIDDGNFEEQGGYEAAKQILANAHHPTAILCASDLMAIGAIRAIREAELKVPEHISIIGFDNMEETHYHEPALTTISFSGYEMGKVAAQKMFHLCSQEVLESNVTILKPELIIRHSTQPIGASII